MKQVLCLIIAFFFIAGLQVGFSPVEVEAAKRKSSATSHVRPYVKKNGKTVSGHTRSTKSNPFTKSGKVKKR